MYALVPNVDKEGGVKISESFAHVIYVALPNKKSGITNTQDRFTSDRFCLQETELMTSTNPITAVGRLLRPLLRRVQGPRRRVLGPDRPERAQPRPAVRRGLQLHGVEPGSNDHG